jgi:hypothetical protein
MSLIYQLLRQPINFTSRDMSYKPSTRVTTEEIIIRLHELAQVDLVLTEAAIRLEALDAEVKWMAELLEKYENVVLE